MDAVMTMSSISEAGKYKVMVDVQPISNNKIDKIICHTGFWRGAFDDDSERKFESILAINGRVVQGDTVRLYGTLTTGSFPQFRLEEAVRLSKSVYELNKIEVRKEHLNDEYIVGCIHAINEQDGETIEYEFRDGMTKERAAILMTYWKPEQPWEMKDLFLAVMMDMDKSVVGPLAEHELDSPNDERAYAICILTDNWDQFEEWLDGRWDEVDPAIEAYKNKHQ